jgi:hypothetical protein
MKLTHVRQEDMNGCGIACLAMVTGKTYQQVNADLTCRIGGITDWTLWTYLADNGYASAWKYPVCLYTNQPRDIWPPALWADVHIAQVQNGTHFVVVLRDGEVLDPAIATPRRYEDYDVSNIGAVYCEGRPG